MLEEHLKEVLSFDVIEADEYQGIESALYLTSPRAQRGGVGLLRDGKLYNFAVSGSAGLWVEPDRLWVVKCHADQMRMLIFEAGKETKTIVSSHLGDVHDVRLIDGELYVVSTATNEIVTLDNNGRILKRWRFPGVGDSWHLNCIDVWNGRLVVSAFGKFKSYRGYKGNGDGAGIIFDMLTQEVLHKGFSAPHSPRLDDEGGVYICNSKEESLYCRKNGREQEVRFPGAFTRGLDFSANEIYVGLSSLRHRPDFKPIENQITNAQIGIVDRRTMQIKKRITLPQTELYDVIAVN